MAGRKRVKYSEQLGKELTKIEGEFDEEAALNAAGDEGAAADKIPLYGLYGDAFFSSVPSPELLAKEKERFYDKKSDEADNIAAIEAGLCKKYGIEPPKYKPNRRGDRGEAGDEILIIGETANDIRHKMLWGIRQEDRTRHVHVLGPSGSGKLLPWSKPILTISQYNGNIQWRQIKDVDFDTLVFTRNGIPAKVIGIYDRANEEIWEVCLKDGQVIECSKDHNWLVRYKSHQRYVEKVMTTEEMLNQGIKRSNGEGQIQGNTFGIPLPEPMQFPEQMLPIPPYTMGALLGDGYTCAPRCHAVYISAGDHEILELILAELPDNYSIRKVMLQDENDYSWEIREQSEDNPYQSAKHLKEKLKELGLDVHAHEKFIPEIYKCGSIAQRRALLKGLMDTDGSAHNGRFTFFTTSARLYEDVLGLVRSLGYMASTHIDKRQYANASCGYEIEIHSNDYENIFALSRKKKDYLDYAANRSSVAKQVYKHKAPEEYDGGMKPDDFALSPYLLGAMFRYSIRPSAIFTNGAVGDEIKQMLSSVEPRIEFRRRAFQEGRDATVPYIDGGRQKNGKHKNLVLYAFRDLGCVGNRTRRRIPEEVLTASVDARQQFLCGLLDMYATFEGRTATYTTVDEGHHDDFVRLATSLGYDVNVNYFQSNKLYSIHIGIADDTMFTLPSKKKQAAELARQNVGFREEYNVSIPIVDIRKTDRKCHMRCIQVDDPSESYIIENYVVTHNSTLLHALGVEDMWYWRGGLLMEPHGDLALGLLRCAPPYRIHDILYLNVLDAEASPGFNPLELDVDATDEERGEAVGKVTSLIAKHFNMESGMVRLNKMLENALVALSYVPGATLLEIMDFYSNEQIRDAILSWMPEGSPQKDSIASIAMNAKADDLASLENRLQRFTSNRYLRHMFGQSHTTVDFFDLMNRGSYIICPVSKGGTTDDTFLKFYGSYIVSEVYKAAVMRESIEEDERVNFSMTLDEFQNFMTGDIEGILSEARKYGLCLMLAHQYLAQLDNETKAAVLQNCATKLSYNLGPIDAPEMARTFAHGITAADMMSIPKYHVLAAPLVKGETLQPFITAVFPPIKLKSEVSGITADLITEITRERYMKKRDDIDLEIADRKERLVSGNRQAMLDLVKKKNS